MNRRLIAFVFCIFVGITAFAQKRGLDMSAPFIGKGTFILEGNLGWSSHVEDDIDFSVVSGYNGGGYAFNASPVFAYVFRDNIALGIRAKYSRTLCKIDAAHVEAGQMKTDIKEYYYLSHKGSGEFFIRPYIPFSSRFAIFADVCVGGSLSQSKNTQLQDGQTAGTWQKGYSIYGGVYPGLVANITSFMAIEVQVGLLTVDIVNSKQIHNQTTEAGNTTKRGNLKLDLTAISAGLSFTIGR